MTEGFQTVLVASDEERRDLFVGAADRLRTNEQNIEKDFWVCWTLDALFNELEAGGPRLLFKGGTSLSKGYGLIERFSEDIDITVFREDIGQPTTFEELEALSGKKRNARLDAIKAACQTYIQGPMLERLSALLQQTLQTANLNADQARVEADPDDPDGQSLLHYLLNRHESLSPVQLWKRVGDCAADAPRYASCRILRMEAVRPLRQSWLQRHPHPCPHRWRSPQD
jgi:hypothetical protein